MNFFCLCYRYLQNLKTVYQSSIKTAGKDIFSVLFKNAIKLQLKLKTLLQIGFRKYKQIYLPALRLSSMNKLILFS